jgi:hypothetical protein
MLHHVDGVWLTNKGINGVEPTDSILSTYYRWSSVSSYRRRKQDSAA